jgi:hypothetical protein
MERPVFNLKFFEFVSGTIYENLNKNQFSSLSFLVLSMIDNLEGSFSDRGLVLQGFMIHKPNSTKFFFPLKHITPVMKRPRFNLKFFDFVSGTVYGNLNKSQLSSFPFLVLSMIDNL